jgi:hypothetical protein
VPTPPPHKPDPLSKACSEHRAVAQRSAKIAHKAFRLGDFRGYDDPLGRLASAQYPQRLSQRLLSPNLFDVPAVAAGAAGRICYEFTRRDGVNRSLTRFENPRPGPSVFFVFFNDFQPCRQAAKVCT